MTMTQSGSPTARDYRKWVLFVVMGVVTLMVLSIDERFLVDRTDEEWQHIAPFQWWLLAHGLAGFMALAIGPFQFSERLRRKHTALHRVLGRIYIGAICVAAPLAIYIGNNWDDDRASAIEGWAQAGGWMLCGAGARLRHEAQPSSGIVSGWPVPMASLSFSSWRGPRTSFPGTGRPKSIS